MDAVLYRTAMSPGIREQHDQFPMIASPEGKMVVGQFGSFIHGLMKTYTKPIEDGVSEQSTQSPFSMRPP
jgi:N-methylhydantoinase B